MNYLIQVLVLRWWEGHRQQPEVEVDGLAGGRCIACRIDGGYDVAVRGFTGPAVQCDGFRDAGLDRFVGRQHVGIRALSFGQRQAVEVVAQCTCFRCAFCRPGRFGPARYDAGT